MTAKADRNEAHRGRRLAAIAFRASEKRGEGEDVGKGSLSKRKGSVFDATGSCSFFLSLRLLRLDIFRQTSLYGAPPLQSTITPLLLATKPVKHPRGPLGEEWPETHKAGCPL